MDKYLVNGYLPTIGIECHVQLKTKTKLFSGEGNDAREAPPNTLVGHVSFGMPGALPVLNEKALELAMRAAFALKTKPQKQSIFERKHYFYPDLPKGYQITQLHQPIVIGGHVEIKSNDQAVKVRINRVQIEEDAGKSTHPTGADYSLVDLNRAGTPLLEIVSEPDMHSAAEAKGYARELYLRMKYADISDANLYYGNMRFDVNVSVGKDGKLGTRTETKNLNSFRSVEKAVDYEIKRQIELLEKGEQVVQETRGWHDDKQKTFSQRSKEDAHDYRYMPDPDLPPVVLDDAKIAEVEKAMPPMPNDYRILFSKLGLDISATETLINSPESARFVKTMLDGHGEDHARRVALWIVNTVPKLDEEPTEAEKQPVSAEAAMKLSQMVTDNKLSSTAAKEIWLELSAKGGDPEEIAEAKNLLQVSDTGALEAIVKRVLGANSKAAEDVRNGEMKAIGFLVGQVMKESQGKANPQIVQELIKKQLGL